MTPQAYWSEEHECWFVPVASTIFGDPYKHAAEPCRVRTGESMTPQAYWSEEHECWFVPVANTIFSVAEPCRVEFKDGQLWITLIDWEDQEHPIRERAER